MTEQLHSFHIPVMGIGHSADTPIRVAPFGISSVISLVDDHLLERLREHYARKNNLDFVRISSREPNSRALRITAYLEVVRTLVSKKFEEIRKQPFFQPNDKQKYFDFLPDDSALKHDHLKLQAMDPGPVRDVAAQHLASRMVPGSIDVNIMVKLDRMPHDPHGQPLGEELTDAKTALRGFAESSLQSSIVFSAGMNPKLFSYVARFRDFYRDATGEMKKKIILKVSDFRSALIQSKFLAKRGLEVSEYRVESGLNCGGHAFPSRGQVIPLILKEFKDRWHEITDSVRPLVRQYYEKMKWPYTEEKIAHRPRITVQGGIGTVGEARRLKERFGADGTGWGSPFLLVPEATHVDDSTRELLVKAAAKDLFLSRFSPLGVPFNTVRGTASEVWTRRRIEEGKPGSPCPKGFAVTNTEFSERPICLASYQFQSKKLEEIENASISEDEKSRQREIVKEKLCICDHLGNGILIKLGIEREEEAPQAICPGPNIAWFNRTYSLKEMVDHIYGRIQSLVPAHRPHMFSKEIDMNVEYLEKLVKESKGKASAFDELSEYKANLEKGIELCVEISGDVSFPDENLKSLQDTLGSQRNRLNQVWESYLQTVREFLDPSQSQAVYS